MADWMVFLEDVAIECGLSPEQKRAFLARFDRANLSRTDKWIVEHTTDDGRQVFAGEPAFTKLMTGIYGAVQRKLFPDLAKVGKGKRGKLEQFLKGEFERRQAHQPPILGEPSQEIQSSRGLKLGAPMPGVRLPENFVARPEALQKVKDMLLLESEKPLVVSAIAGLGGLGKSVLATAIVLDGEVQARFEDGILWVTLGQNPDLLGLVGDWIRVLDRSKESLSSTTLEGAKGYLQSLLVERRMLLVIDDVWNAAHADWFRVGGSGCRVLVTTREAVIPGADRYDLDVMSPEDALTLIRETLGDKWQAGMEESALEFADMLGYLPLALRLMALQIGRGRRWKSLKQAFLQERLRCLDQAGVRLADLSEQERRQYSLAACFEVSLARLREDEPKL